MSSETCGSFAFYAKVWAVLISLKINNDESSKKCAQCTNDTLKVLVNGRIQYSR